MPCRTLHTQRMQQTLAQTASLVPVNMLKGCQPRTPTQATSKRSFLQSGTVFNVNHGQSLWTSGGKSAVGHCSGRVQICRGIQDGSAASDVVSAWQLLEEFTKADMRRPSSVPRPFMTAAERATLRDAVLVSRRTPADRKSVV